MTDFRKKLEKLEEQTVFLLEKQQEAAQYCQNEFSNLLSVIDQIVQETDEESDEYKDLLSVHEMVLDQSSSFEKDIADDVDYLSEQLKGIKQISEMEDEKKAEDFLNSVVEEDMEILETADFKADLIKDSEASKKSFDLIIEDIKSALNDGDIQNLKLVLESMKSEHESEEDFDNDDSDVDCDDCYDSSCSSSACSSCPGCSVDDESDDENVNIFEALGKSKETLNAEGDDSDEK